VDLVHEEHVALGEIGQDAHEVSAAFERGAGRGHKGHAHLVGEHRSQRPFARALGPC